MEDCERITRKSASNLALAFVLLPKPKRRCMSALYAFCRKVDDIGQTGYLRRGLDGSAGGSQAKLTVVIATPAIHGRAAGTLVH